MTSPGDTVTGSREAGPSPDRLPVPRLTLLHSPGRGQATVEQISLTPGALTLGREARKDAIAFLGDPRVSRVHARLEVARDQATVRVVDCGSHNGTFVNRARVVDPQGSLLRDGDVLRLGDSFLLVRWIVATSADAEVAELTGVSPAVAAVRAQIDKVAADLANVLLLGETGTGKEVASSALHRLSGRPGPLIAVNCSAIPADLAESQFFGHSAGAFTGAKAHRGLFRAAHGGTLFLDEVGDLPPQVQPKLLRAVEEKAVIPVGATESVSCNVRLVAATNRDLQKDVAEGKFRNDLLARLAGVVLRLPPLRERREDVLLLLDHAGASPVGLPAEVIEMLVMHAWPHNVRELVKVANHLRLFGADAALRERLSGAAALTSPDPAPLTPEPARPRRLVAAPGRDALVALLRKHHGVIQDVAEELGCSRRQVGRWLDQHRIDRDLFRA